MARETKKNFLRNARGYWTGLGTAMRSPQYTGKVFCVGYNKTGTTSVGKAIAKLGYRHTSFNMKVWTKYYENNQIVKALQYATKFDSFDDLPWLKEDMIPVLDRVFPKSKFIYLTRDDDSWKTSFYNWRFKVYGKYPDMKTAFERYCLHREFVMDYFQNRTSEEFIVLDVKDPLGFKKLAGFLGKRTDCESFPHYNKT